MDQQILNTVLKNTYTLSRLKHRFKTLKSYLLKAIFGSEKETAPANPADLQWLSSLSEDFYKQFNKDNVYPLFDQIDAKINALKPLIFYLPFETDDNIAMQIGEYSRNLFNNPTVILDIKYDPNVIAGCAIVWNGVYRDYSLRARIKDKQQQILQSFKQNIR